jgi:hypothetical protein
MFGLGTRGDGKVPSLFWGWGHPIPSLCSGLPRDRRQQCRKGITLSARFQGAGRTRI